MELIEREILQGIKSGDQHSFNMLIRLYFQPLSLYAGNILANSEHAKDLVQEFFLKLWSNRADLEVRTSLKSYLFRSVHNLSIDYLRRELSHLKVKTISYDDLSFRLGIYEIEDTDPFFESFFSKEAEVALQRAIDELPAQCRTIFILCRFEQLTYPEIAKQLNLSVSTVKSQMIRAMHKIKDSLKEYL